MRGIFIARCFSVTHCRGRSNWVETDNSSKLGSSQLLRLEALSRPLHHSLYNEIDRHEGRVGLGLYFDFPFTTIGTLQRMTIARAVNSMSVVTGQTCSDYRRAGLHSALANGRKEMNRLHEFSSDLVGYFLQESFSSLDHVVCADV
jgi:hypothetical protein